MNRYYINKNVQPKTCDHEVHRDGCEHGAEIENREYLGWHDSCEPALAKAKKYYSTADGCAYCCPKCHKS